MNARLLYFLEDELVRIPGEGHAFALYGDGFLMREAFLRVVALTHPLHGATTIYLVTNNQESYRPYCERMQAASDLGLVRFCFAKHDDPRLSGCVAIGESKQDSPTTANPSAIIELNAEGEEIIYDELYSATMEVLSLYGKPLSSFRLPKDCRAVASSRDWHYFGPAYNCRQFNEIKGQVLHAITENDGVLCPKGCHADLVSTIQGKDVEPQQFYDALRTCYEQDCLLSDMARYEHDTWVLRACAFHPCPDKKRSMFLPYRDLVERELPKLSGTDAESAFKNDILYSDYLVPLLHLMRLAADAK